MATQAAFQAFSDPDSYLRDLSHEQRAELYGLAWAYQQNTMFDNRNGVDWSKYLHSRQLYKHTRLIYNPVPMINGFYVDNIWRAIPNKQFESLATPLSPETDEKVVATVAQIDQWSNWLADAAKIKKYAAATGNVLVEGIDDLERQKVYHKAIWPGYVTEIETNSTGDVLAYTIEYDVWDSAARANYRYKKIVTREESRFFKNDVPFVPPGRTAEVEPNPYGFCFAVYIKHTDDGSERGMPACTNLGKVDEANSLGCHLHDSIHKTVESPKLIASDGKILPIIGATRNDRTGQISPGSDPRLDWIVLQAEKGAAVHDLAGSIALAEAEPYLTNLLASFTDDYPELQANSIIKENSQLSGAALERLLGPAQNRLNSVQFGYNQQLIKLRQMGIAVAGFRVSNSSWPGRDKSTDVFKPFNLNSFANGDLNFGLVATVLVQQSDAENEDVLTKKAARAVELETIVGTKEAQRIAGYTDEQIQELENEKSQENKIIVDDGTDPLADPNSDPGTN